MAYLSFLSTWLASSLGVSLSADNLATRTPVTLPLPALLQYALGSAPAPQRPRLPLELVYHVLDALADAGDTPSLLACALLSRATSRHAKSLLYKSISISTREAFFALEEALVNPNLPFAPLVSSLSISLNFDSPYGLTESHFARLVSLCPNLRSISISIYGCEPVFSHSPQQLSVKDRPAPSLGEHTLQVLAQYKGITSLEVANWSDNADILLQLLRVWPQVKRLSVSGTIPCIPTPITEPLVFRDLESLSITAQTPPFILVLQRLLFDALGTSLRELHLGIDADSDLIQRLAPPNLTSLRVLSLPHCDTAIRNVLKKCLSLRYLKIAHPPSDNLTEVLSNSVETVAFGVDSSSQIDFLIQLIQTHKNLRRVCIHPLKSLNCDVLDRLCRSKGIEFTVCRTNKQFEDY